MPTTKLLASSVIGKPRGRPPAFGGRPALPVKSSQSLKRVGKMSAAWFPSRQRVETANAPRGSVARR